MQEDAAFFAYDLEDLSLTEFLRASYILHGEAAIVVDENSFTHFVNGELELSEAIRFEPQRPGRTSLGVQLNKVRFVRNRRPPRQRKVLALVEWRVRRKFRWRCSAQ
jgi:hypothetical protein